ncbi:MAG: hypothetical protein ACJ8C4_05395 [Gemmataceae bacterium]
MFANCALMLLAGLAQTSPPQPPPIVFEFSKTTTFYYQKPDPSVALKLFHELIKKENAEHPWFADREHTLNLFAAQLGDIAARNPKIVREYEAAFAEASVAGRRIIVRVLTNCGDKETVNRINGWLADPKVTAVRGELEALKKHLEGPNRKGVRDRAAHTPADLDFLWCNFFITGEYAPIARILDVLDLPDVPENATMRRVASWSLGSNMQQHAKLLELVKAQVKNRPEPSRKMAESFIQILEALPGQWESQDGEKNPLKFGKDGSFKCGFIKDNAEWKIAVGNFSVVADGKVATKAEHAGSTLYQTFTFKDGVLSGSRGPNPNVQWKKVKP